MNKLKSRQERFCQRFVENANSAAAAKAAGYAPASARNTGYRLLRNPRIVQRISEIQTELAHAHCRQIDNLLGKLETVYRRAIDDHQFSAAARAVELQAKLSGLSDKPSTRTSDRKTKPKDASSQSEPNQESPIESLREAR